MNKLLIRSALIFFLGMFWISQLYCAAEVGQHFVRPLATRLSARESAFNRFGRDVLGLLGDRLGDGFEDVRAAVVDFGATQADALRETASRLKARFCQALEEHKHRVSVQGVIDDTKNSARTLASMCVVAGSMNNIARNPLTHKLLPAWGSNGTKHAVKAAPVDSLVVDAEEGFASNPSSALKRLQKMGIPVGAVLDGTIAAAAVWGLTRSGVLPTATLFAQAGLAGSCGTSFIIKASGKHDTPALVVPFTSMGMSFSIMSIIGGVQMMVDNCPEVKKLRYKPLALQQFTKELKALESKEMYLTFLKRVASNAARTTKGPLAFVGGAGIVMCNVFNICDGFADICSLVSRKSKSELE